MKAIALTLFVLSTAMLFGAAPQLSSDEIETEFESPAILTNDEIQVVKELALNAGLPSVGKIYTYNIHPSSLYGISVRSKETVRGREITSSSLTVGYEKWQPGGGNRPGVKFRSGDFWAYSSIDKARFATFSSSSGERRIMLSEKTPLAVADKIFALLEAGKIRFKDPEMKKTVDEWRTAEFTVIGMSWETDDQGALRIAVKARPAGMSLKCTLQDGWIMVIDVQSWIA